MGIMTKGRSALRGTARSLAAALPACPLPVHAAAKIEIPLMTRQPAIGDACNKVAAILARYPTIQS